MICVWFVKCKREKEGGKGKERKEKERKEKKKWIKEMVMVL